MRTSAWSRVKINQLEKEGLRSSTHRSWSSSRHHKNSNRKHRGREEGTQEAPPDLEEGTQEETREASLDFEKKTREAPSDPEEEK